MIPPTHTHTHTTPTANSSCNLELAPKLMHYRDMFQLLLLPFWILCMAVMLLSLGQCHLLSGRKEASELGLIHVEVLLCPIYNLHFLICPSGQHCKNSILSYFTDNQAQDHKV